MQITPSYLSSYFSDNQEIRSQYLKTADLADKTMIEEKKTPYEKETYSLPRQTYGLTVLEKMSDDEYHAFLRATAEMSESEKILAAQTFYQIGDLYQTKKTSEKNPYLANNGRDFPSIYQNAYQAILAEKQKM